MTSTRWLLVGLLLLVTAGSALAQSADPAAAADSGPTLLQFVLALLPLLVVLAGIIFLQQSGATMAIVGWAVAVILAVVYFKTPLIVALGASWYGFVKSFGIV
jgi:hypothetical protein